MPELGLAVEVEVGLNWWVWSVFACQKVLLFTICVGFTT